VADPIVTTLEIDDITIVTFSASNELSITIPSRFNHSQLSKSLLACWLSRDNATAAGFDFLEFPTPDTLNKPSLAADPETNSIRRPRISQCIWLRHARFHAPTQSSTYPSRLPRG
jgi:hypothetical protein